MSTKLNVLQYGCECGKKFSGEPIKINMLIRLHYKKCKCPRSKESEPINVTTSGSNPNSCSKIIGQPTNISLLKSFIGGN